MFGMARKSWGVRIWHATRHWRRRHLGATVHACPRKGDIPKRHIYRQWNCGAPNLIAFMHYPNLAMYWWLALKGHCNESISMILTGDGWQASLHLSSLHGVASSGFVCISSISYISLYAWLVVYLPLWNIWKSVGMIIPNIWENQSHVPYHQPDAYWSYVNVGSLWMCLGSQQTRFESPCLLHTGALAPGKSPIWRFLAANIFELNGGKCPCHVWLFDYHKVSCRSEMEIPSGKRLHSYGKSPFYSWENPLFLWPCSIAILT